MDMLGPLTKAETGMEGERGAAPTQGISSWWGGSGDGKENKVKPRCITSCGGLGPSRFVARKPPREPETTLPSLFFSRGALRIVLGLGARSSGS